MRVTGSAAARTRAATGLAAALSGAASPPSPQASTTAPATTTLILAFLPEPVARPQPTKRIVIA